MKDEMQKIKVGNNIRKLRELKNIPQKEIAEKLEMSLSGYTRIERDEVNLTSDNALKIAEILGVSPGTLFDFDSEKIIFNTSITKEVRMG